MRALVFSLVLAAGCGPRQTEAPGPTPEPTPADTTGAAIAFADQADYRAQRQATERALAEATGRAQASTVGACRVVPTSEQACGGPTSFAVYSAEAPGADEVERLAARLVAMDAVANAQFEYVSTCMAYDPPTPVVRDGRCVDPSAERP